MALVSPGVEVDIIDQSQYLPAPLNSIPFVLLATATNKSDPSGTGIAQGTTPANAGKLYQVTSQRDLVTLYGTPTFYTTSIGTPIQGDELNEYGLLAAYSALGASNNIYCLRADIDLASLQASTGRPTGDPADGTYWLNTAQSTWGIFQFSATTGQFTAQTPIVITDSALISGGFPLTSLGAIGNYAVNAIPTYATPTSGTAGQMFYKAPNNTWVVVGTSDWMDAWPTVQGTQSSPSLTMGDTLTLNINGLALAGATITVLSGWVLDDLVSAINNLQFGYLTALNSSNRLVLFMAQDSLPLNSSIQILGTGTILADLGITAGLYYQPAVSWGTSAQQPLWQTGQSVPRPTGSVWFKIGAAGSGLNSVVSYWNEVALSWISNTVSYATSDWNAIYALDSTGGKNIPAGSVYAQYNFNQVSSSTGLASAPVYYWERIATGPTVVTGLNTAPSFTNGPYTLRVSSTIPGSTTVSTYTVSLADNTDASDFVIAWSAANIPYTTATVTDTGAIQITQTAGGVIYINDFDTAGFSSGLCDEAGFIPGTTTCVKEGPFLSLTYTPGQGVSFPLSSTTGIGTGVQLYAQNYYQNYFVFPVTFVSAGSGYVVGDKITIHGSYIGGVSPANDLTIAVTAVDGSGGVTGVVYVSGAGASAYTVQLSNWVEFNPSMIANEGAPTLAPADFTNWFYSTVDDVDIMINTSAGWRGYRNVSYNSSGFPNPSGTNTTDVNGPINSASVPTTQSTGTPLSYGDIWIDTSDLENYPLINRWQSVNSVDQWVRLDNSNQTSPTGVLFDDARWATNGVTNPANDPIPSIKSLLSSNYLDLGAPDAALYPVGMLLFNLRRSGNDVKQYRVNYFNADRFPDEQSYPTERDAWVTESGLQSDGSPYMGRKAQRAMVVKAMKATIDTNAAIRDEDNGFNLIAAPNYPELQQNMIVLNNDRGDTGFIIGDTPMRLPDDATLITAWANSQPAEGGPSRDTYLGLFYPSGLTNDLSGNLVAVPASHMMIRTFLRNDSVAYPWFAPAGTRRGIIDNATGIGYIDPKTGEFQLIKTRLGIRDVLYTNEINPLVYFTGQGLLNYGNKSSFASSSALDRINVARLVAYLRRQLTLAARPFVFEPNDTLTRGQITGVIQSLLVDLVAKRGVYDYLVICDLSNNTPARIDRNELWVDVAIEPVKAAEFIYVPVRILNTGELKAL